MEHQVKSKQVVCKSYKEGGLSMFGISFWASMKISWLRKLTENSSQKDFVLTLYPDLGKLNVFGGEFSNAKDT